MSTRTKWFLIWIAAILPLLGWWLTGLFDLDEGFYAAVVGEMNRRHEWITPYFNGHPWFEKPILLYWAAKPCVAIFGNALGPRMPSVLSMIGLYALTGWFAKRRFGEEVAQRAVLIISGCLLVIAVGRMMLTDGLLCLFLSCTLVFFYESLVDSNKLLFRTLCGICLGLAVLAKGPVSIGFLGLVGIWLLARHPSVRQGMKGGWIGFVLGASAMIASWYLPAYLKHGDVFVQKFLIEQNIGRFTGGDDAHTLHGIAGWVFYLPILLAGFLPWSLWIPKALAKRDKASLDQSFLACWAVIIFVFFTISGAKLMHYIVPIAMPVAILVSLQLKPKVLPFAAAWCIVMAIVANVGFIFWYGASGQREAHQIATGLGSIASSEDVVMYQLSRREHDKGTGGTTIQETSLPSFLFYYNRPALDTDDLNQVLKDLNQIVIFTRVGRIGPDDFETVKKAGRVIKKYWPGFESKNYELYKIDSAYDRLGEQYGPPSSFLQAHPRSNRPIP